MKKNKQEEDEKVNTSSGKRDIFVLILIFVGVPLYYYFSSSVHPEVTEDKIHESINWLTYLPFLIAIVCIGIFFLLRYLGKSSTTAGTESQNSVTNFRFSKQAAKNVGTVLGLLVAGFGIWLLWYYFKDTKKEEVQVVQPIPTSPRTVTYNWLDQNEPFEKKFTVHFDKKEVKQYKYMGQRYSYWPNVGETAHITVMNTSGKVLLDEVVKTVSIGNCKRDVRVCENVKEYGDTYIVSCDIADLNVYKQKE